MDPEPWRQVTIRINQKDFDRLRTLAEQNFRDPKQQLAWMVKNMIRSEMDRLEQESK